MALLPLHFLTSQAFIAMPKEIINNALGELRRAGENLPDADSRNRLGSLVENIEKTTSTLAIQEEEHHGLLDDIRSAIDHFEVEHPRITEALNRIMVALSNMGI